MSAQVLTLPPPPEKGCPICKGFMARKRSWPPNQFKCMECGQITQTREVKNG